MSLVGAAGLTGATSLVSAAPAAAYGLGLAGASVARHPQANSIASHAGGMAEGLVHGMGAGRAAHAASAAVGVVPAMVKPHWHGWLGRAAHAMGKVLPAVMLGVGFIDTTTTLDAKGARGLVTSQGGRNGVINALGGGLLLMPHPAFKLAGAGVMATGLVNDLGGMRRLDDAPH